MSATYVVTGTLTDGKTLVLDEALPAVAGKVRVTVEAVETTAPVVTPTTAGKPPWLQTLEGIWEEQRRRGYVPRSSEEIDAQIREERESWGD